MFAYGGWQTSSFVSGEMRDPRRDLARGVLFGMLGVVILYAAVAFTSVYVLGPAGWPRRGRPPHAVMRLAFGDTGVTLVALGIAISALGFLSQSMLTTPRSIRDGGGPPALPQFRRSERRTHAPVVAILLQGAAAIVIASSAHLRPDFDLCRLCRFHLVRTDRRRLVRLPPPRRARAWFQAPAIPGPPFCLRPRLRHHCRGDALEQPDQQRDGLLILAAGVPAFLYWQRRREAAA